MQTKFTLVLCFSYLLSYAQYTVSGTITDIETNEFISWADVLLLREGKVIYNVISNDNGQYEINEIEKGDYVLKVNYLGYQDFEIPVQFNSDSKKILNIKLKSNIESLDEVVITAERTTIEFKGDKRIINVGQDLLAAGASTENILQQIPSVDVDVSGNVSLRNDANVIIMIDGKRSTLSSADIIAQVPANLIHKIEVITNPSAKYDAEGVSGLINIITKKLRRNGGNLNLNTGIGEQGRYHITLNGNYRFKKFNFYSNYNYREPYFGAVINILRQTGNEIISQQTRNDFDNATVNYFKSGVDFFIDSTNTLSLSAIYARNTHTIRNRTNTNILNLIDNSEQAILFDSGNSHKHVSKELNVNYRKEFNGRDQYLEVDANLANFPNRFIILQDEFTEGEDDFFIDDQQIRENTITTFSADYFWNNKNKKILEIGVKTEFKKLDNFQNRVESSDVQVISTIEDDFLYEDRILAAYVVYEKAFENFSLKGGLRLEDYHIDLNSNDIETFDNQYTNLFPSFSASYKLKKNEFSANYTRRISRPGIFALNPFVVETGNLTRRRGNPFLQPSFADKIELNYNRKFKKFTINLSTFYSEINDVIQFIFVQEGDFIVNTFDNVGTSKQYGIELFSKINWFKWWDTNLTMNYYFADFETNQFANTSTFSQQYRMQNSFRFAKTWSIQLNGNLNPRRENLQQVIQSNYWADIAISKRFAKNKGQVILRVNDVFRTTEFESERILTNLTERTVNNPFSRYAYLTFRYNLSIGKDKLKNRQRKNREYIRGNVD
ncbi:TonB-dependent receptor [Flavobacteriaceae bacterium R38]|nr:TonB-dependent receptor [Flavobacteriaceae bacterium R38]